MSSVLNLNYMPDGRVINETGHDPAIERVTGFVRHFVGADLGQANDFSSAVDIKDQQLPFHDGTRVKLGQRERTVVFADKFRGVSYVDVVDYLIRLRNAPPFGGKSQLVIDGTSIGRVVSDMMHEQSVDHTAVQMTGGQEWRRSGRYVNASKTLMIENLAVLFASGDLKFAHDLPLRSEIEEDLASFTTQTTAAGNQIITQSRNASGHGDTGIALIVAAFASQYLTPQSIRASKLVGMF
ncbi:hypothetical protein SAMN06273572_108109 [Monaibacterium marinum]|uniref:Terminase-like family protein n=1 Tax=Pontivivens marinum TaxID=1690039 RepID=A0A2C9CVU0_9RHOB|nr:hypothetical protein [Monaibacterium marinum]SOH95235.1 hypothetical protein SAMN06273572_108109 [Monaibacterium marinum]